MKLCMNFVKLWVTNDVIMITLKMKIITFLLINVLHDIIVNCCQQYMQ